MTYTFLASLLLQNLLVAMMSETYAHERENEGFDLWWMQHAGVVLCHEREGGKEKDFASAKTAIRAKPILSAVPSL